MFAPRPLPNDVPDSLVCIESDDFVAKDNMCIVHKRAINRPCKVAETMHNMQGPKTCDNTLQPTPRTFAANAKTNPICGYRGLSNVDYTFSSRFEDEKLTNPEEMIAGA